MKTFRDIETAIEFIGINYGLRNLRRFPFAREQVRDAIRQVRGMQAA
ncbi:hypothetical protein BcepSauron_050 [Burkholderia phage BcepSauron]|uniref:Uncharacterized protein n=2 Tax=Sarumanvirus TaxID=2843450 RepID=A0A482MMX2_9CAUD|nr:hypothetical protein H1O16_gp049 [Burkholderia phage BcepSaruman]YP_009904428.1 hypothetical protein H1O17_gp050 [Burkholderia phage BcepSauron]QBQ74430.1 hypothetical protein BcepSauron_050 [Burkholderia phage BcepSauron]QBX06462.1 hypothetical protein BcepSaruman_049 [Burkholderia phage BcepSaruman]